MGPPTGDLADFPAFELRRTTPYYRIHRSAHGPWYFSGDASGRFDLAHPSGTCYLSEEPIGAFLEVFRFTTLVAEEDVDHRSLSTVVVPAVDRPLADCTVEEARGFGVTAEIHAGQDYALTQSWAQAFRRAGFAGIRYRLRHDPAQSLVGIAYFGRITDRFPVEETEVISAALVNEAADRFGIVVIPAPPAPRPSFVLLD
jgi:RES domain